MDHPPARRGLHRSTLPWYIVPAVAFVCSGFVVHPDSTEARRVTSEETAAQPFYSGVFLGDDATRPDRIESALREFEKKAAHRPALIKTFYRLDDDFSARGWAGQVMRRIARSGSTNYVALDLRWRGAPASGLLSALAAGSADAELRRVARQLRDIGGPVLVEPAWEMNGNWSYPWQGALNGEDRNAPERFVTAWQHVVDVFRAEGALNLRWVFSPNIGNPAAGAGVGPTHWNWYGNYYPGDGYVDYVGAHGFNAPSLWGAPYQAFSTLFDGSAADRLLSDLADRYPSKPIIIGEFASEETPGHSKADWIRDAYEFLQAHPRVVGAIWFDMKKETDWHLDSSPGALAAYREAMSRPRVRSSFADVSDAASRRLAAR